MMKNVSVAATGLTGLIGSRLAELLRGEFEWRGLRYEDGFDITDPEKVDKTIGKFDGKMVLHLAAFTDLNAANKELGDKNGMCWRINVLGTRHIAGACQKYGKYLIHVSTDAVFGGDKQSAYTEEDKPNPIEWYGQTKFWAEEEVEKSGCGAVVIRFAYPFRARFEPKKDFVRKIIDQLKQKETIKMFTDTVFTPTFIDDVAAVMREIILKRPTGIFHVVGSTSLSPFAAANEISETFNLDNSLIQPQTLADYLAGGGRPYPKFAGLSNEKLKKELGVEMLSFPEALSVMKKQ